MLECIVCVALAVLNAAAFSVDRWGTDPVELVAGYKPRKPKTPKRPPKLPRLTKPRMA